MNVDVPNIDLKYEESVDKGQLDSIRGLRYSSTNFKGRADISKLSPARQSLD